MLIFALCRFSPRIVEKLEKYTDWIDKMTKKVKNHPPTPTHSRIPAP